VGGSGTLGAQVGTLAQGPATIGATTSTLTQTGTAAESARTGTFSNGTGSIAATTGSSTTQLQEVATSDPVIVFIHQPASFSGLVFHSTTLHGAAARRAHFVAPKVQSLALHGAAVQLRSLASHRVV
jgi:hypothetical protein